MAAVAVVMVVAALAIPVQADSSSEQKFKCSNKDAAGNEIKAELTRQGNRWSLDAEGRFANRAQTTHAFTIDGVDQPATDVVQDGRVELERDGPSGGPVNNAMIGLKAHPDDLNPLVSCTLK